MPSRSRRDLWKNLWSKPPEWSPVVPEPSGQAAGDRQATWIVASRQAMGTFFEIRFAAHTFNSVALAEKCFDLIDDLELLMTIYRDDSALARLNATYHESPVKVDRGLYDLLTLARSIHHATDGAYDITTGALSRAWGFVKGPRRVPDDHELAEAVRRTGLRRVIFDDEARTLRATDPGVEINLGSIGKGYAIDRVVGLIKAHPWPTPAMVHGGRSSLYALGHQPGTLFEPWTIALHNPLEPGRSLVELKLVDQAVGTSGGTFQSFEADGRVYGHIIDPRTGVPPAGPLSVTVIAPTAAEADAISTALYLTGPATAQRLIESRPDLGAIFLRRSAADDQPELLVMNVPRDSLKSDDVAVTFISANERPPDEWIEHRAGE